MVRKRELLPALALMFAYTVAICTLAYVAPDVFQQGSCAILAGSVLVIILAIYDISNP